MCVCDVSHSVAQEMLLKEDVVNETGQKKGKKGNPFMTDPHQINTLRRDNDRVHSKGKRGGKIC